MKGKKQKESKAKLTDSSKEHDYGDSISPVESTGGNLKPSAVPETPSSKKQSGRIQSNKPEPVASSIASPGKSTRGRPKASHPPGKGKIKNVVISKFESEASVSISPAIEKLEEKVLDPNPASNLSMLKDLDLDLWDLCRSSKPFAALVKSLVREVLASDYPSHSSSCVATSQPVATERQTSVSIPCEVPDSTYSVEESENSIEIVPGEKSTGSREGSCVDTFQPLVNDERQSKNLEPTSVAKESLESTRVNEESAVNLEALDNEAVYEERIRSIDSELDSLFQKISEINLKIRKLYDEDDKVENESLAILREIKDILESFEEENEDSKNLKETCNPKAMSNKESRIQELRTLLQLRTPKSIGLIVLQTQKSHWIELLDELYRRRSSTMTDLDRLKSGSECLSAPRKCKRTRVALSGMSQDLVLSTAVKTIFWEKQPALTKKRLAASLGPLVFSRLKSKWVEFAEQKITGDIQWAIDQRTMSELKENVERAIRVVDVLSDNVVLKKLLKFKALVFEGSLSFESSIGTRVGEIGCRYHEVCGLSSRALALDDMGVVSSELSTRVDEIWKTHSESCEVIGDLCQTDSTKTVVDEKVDWIDSVLMTLQEVSSMESKSQFKKEKQKAYSELVDFFKEMDKLDSKITPLDEQALEHESEKAFLSRKLIGCMFEHPSPKVATRSDAESLALDARVGMSNAELLIIRMQQLKNMSTIRECREYVSESQLNILQRRKLLVKQKSKLQEQFKQELKSKFHPAASLGALQMQKAEMMAHSDSLSKRKSKLMARLKALSKRNAEVIKIVNVKQLP